jgi:hypothetical protein
MKRVLRIFELSRNEQRVVLMIVLILITIAFVAYERRSHFGPHQARAMEPKPSTSAVEIRDENE